MGKIWKNMNNLRQTAYKLCHVCHRPMPAWAAKCLALGNRSAQSNGVALKTCDGSRQAVHPSLAQFRGKTYLACTPYPYGLEFYENPCLYIQEENGTLVPVPGMAPVVAAKAMGKEHYSDPALVAGEELTLIYRRCQRSGDGKIDQLYSLHSTDGENWSASVLQAQAPGDQLISPTVDGKEGRLFCVEADPAIDSKLVWYDYQSGRLGEKHTCGVNGLSDDWFVWHLDVCRSENGTLRGLFMLRKKYTRKIVSKLALFRWEKDAWQWDADVIWTPEEAAAIQFVYKSAFAGERKLLCSACDPKNRYYLFYKEI